MTSPDADTGPADTLASTEAEADGDAGATVALVVAAIPVEIASASAIVMSEVSIEVFLLCKRAARRGACEEDGVT